MEGTLFGLNEERIAELGMTWGVGGFIALMLFIIWKLAVESKAGRFGTFVLFFVLAFGILGFVAKSVIQWLLKSSAAPASVAAMALLCRADDGLDRPALPLLSPSAVAPCSLYTEMVTTGALLHGDARAICTSIRPSIRSHCNWVAANLTSWRRQRALASRPATMRSISTAVVPRNACSEVPSVRA